MTTLPSFVELMATLGLGGPDDALEPTKLSVHHSRSSSHSSTASAFSASSSNVTSAASNIYSIHRTHSPSIVVSSHEGSPERDVPGDIRRSRATTRYSPYGSIVSSRVLVHIDLVPDPYKAHSRKASMPILNAERTLERPARVSTQSRPPSLCRILNGRPRPSQLLLVCPRLARPSVDVVRVGQITSSSQKPIAWHSHPSLHTSAERLRRIRRPRQPSSGIDPQRFRILSPSPLSQLSSRLHPSLRTRQIAKTTRWTLPRRRTSSSASRLTSLRALHGSPVIVIPLYRPASPSAPPFPQKRPLDPRLHQLHEGAVLTTFSPPTRARIHAQSVATAARLPSLSPLIPRARHLTPLPPAI